MTGRTISSTLRAPSRMLALGLLVIVILILPL
jgi:hypothetical protein